MDANARLARRALLFRSGDRGRRDGQRPEFVGEFGGIEASACRRPVFGSELEVTITRPERNDADHLGEVGLGIESVELAGDDEREEVRGRGGVIVGTEEQPRLPTGADGSSECALAVIMPRPGLCRVGTTGTANVVGSLMLGGLEVGIVRGS